MKVEPTLKLFNSWLCFFFLIIFQTILADVSGTNISLSADECSNGVDGEIKLMNKLKRVLPTAWPPLDMENKTVYVYIDLFKLQEVDEKDGLWVAKLFLYYYYISPSATWNSSHYNHGTPNTFFVPQRTFWTPDIVVREASLLRYVAFNEQVVYQDGMVLASSSLLSYQLSCGFDVSEFPYDEQTCHITISPYASTDVNFLIDTQDEYFPRNETHKPQLPLQYYIENEQWELMKPIEIIQTNLTFHNQHNRQTLIVKVGMRRRPMFYQMIFVYPSVLLYTLSAITFFIPPDSGEKISFTVTILLTEIVSYSSIVDVVPASSNNIPLMIYFIAAVTMHLSCTCVVAATVVNIHHNSSFVTMYGFLQRAISSPYVFFLLLKQCPVPPKQSKVRINPDSGTPGRIETSTKLTAMTTQLNSEMSITQNTQVDATNMGTTAGETKAATPTDDSETMLQWRYLATMVDRIFFFIHISVMATLLLTFRILFTN